jgi:capsular exopolysaccharide synthesis family protein
MKSQRFFATKKSRREAPQSPQPPARPRRPLTVERRERAHLEYERIGIWLRNPTLGRRVQAVMVVACRSGSGSTTTTALLGTTLAEKRGSRVLIIDSNFRTPGLNLAFQIDGEETGLESSIDALPLESRIRRTNRENLYVLANDHLSAGVPGILEDQGIDDLLAELKDRFDFILIDAAPALDFPDAYALAPKVDGVILVAESDETPIAEAQRARIDLERAGGRMLGVVLNRSRDYIPRFVRRLLRGSC